MGKVGAVKFRPFLILSKKAGTLFLIQPPVTIVTAPEGHWGPDSPDPLRRSAPGGLAKKAGTLFLIQPPVTIVTAPGGDYNLRFL